VYAIGTALTAVQGFVGSPAATPNRANADPGAVTAAADPGAPMRVPPMRRVVALGIQRKHLP
jgi:hypothetical protein